MNEQQPRTIWGLNFLQDDKSEPDEITGAYDPEQEVWLEQVQGGGAGSLISTVEKKIGTIFKTKLNKTEVRTSYRTKNGTDTMGDTHWD